MYQVLNKDMIELEIVPYFTRNKKGFKPKTPLYEIINAILYKLKMEFNESIYLSIVCLVIIY